MAIPVFLSLVCSFVQIGAWVSDQSEPIGSRQELDDKAKGIEVRLDFWRQLVDHHLSAGMIRLDIARCCVVPCATDTMVEG